MNCRYCGRTTEDGAAVCAECAALGQTQLRTPQPPPEDTVTLGDTPENAVTRGGGIAETVVGSRGGDETSTLSDADISLQSDDRFTLTEVLGEGAQGQVCRAYDKRLQRQIAIKFPRRGAGESASEAQAILSEARRAARLNHPNVVTIYECGVWNGRPFIAMEYVDGSGLDAVLADVGRISVERFLKYADQILKALQAAHESGIVHRDLKPANILLGRDGTLRLTDFGIAHIMNAKTEPDATGILPISGTPNYMAPEQWLGRKSDHRADIYAFGCVAYRLLTGDPPFKGNNVAQHHLESKPPSMRSRVPHIPASLEAVIGRCLEKDPGDRYQSVRDLRAALDRAVRDDQLTASAPAAPRKLRPFAVAVASLVVLVGAGVGFFGFHPEGRAIWSDLTAGTETAPSDAEANVGDRANPTTGEEAARRAAAAEAQRRAAERRTRGLAILEDAKGLSDPEARMKKANEALALLDGEDAAAARAVVEAAREEAARATEASVRSRFDALVEQAKNDTRAGRLDDAGRNLEQAAAMMDRHPFLNPRDRDLREARLPLLQQLAERAAMEARFEEARSRFDEAARTADGLGRPILMEQFRKRAEAAGRLALLAMLAERDPRVVIVQLRRFDDEETFPSARLVAARALANVGRRSEARRTLEAFLDSDPAPPAAELGRALLAALSD